MSNKLDAITLAKNAIINAIQKKLPSKSRFLLLLDSKSRKIVSCACGKFDLYDEGCIDIDFIENPRECIPDIDVIYLLTPTEENIHLIIKDYTTIEGKVDSQKGNFVDRLMFCGMESLKVELANYDRIHVLFTSPFSEDLIKPLQDNPIFMSKLGNSTIETINMNFICFENQIINLDIENTLLLYGPDEKYQNDIRLILEGIVQGLQSVCIVLQELPVIRYKQESRLEVIVKKFSSELHKYAHDNPNWNYQGKNDSSKRSTMIIFDRSTDMVSPFIHDFNYQTMVYDLLDVSKEKEYTYKTERENGEVVDRTVLLNETDPLWMKYRYLHFASVLDLLAQEAQNFEDYKNRLKNSALDGAGTEGVAQLIRKVGDLDKLNALVSLHSRICNKLLDIFKTRSLVNLNFLEQIVSAGLDRQGNEVPIEEVRKLVKTGFENMEINMCPEDKARLLLIYLASQKGITQLEFDQLVHYAGLNPEFTAAIANAPMLGLKIGYGLMLREEEIKSRQRRYKERLSDLVTNGFEPIITDICRMLLDGKLAAGLYPIYNKDLSGQDSLSPINQPQKPRISQRRIRLQTNDSQSDEYEGSRLIVVMIGGISFAEIKSLKELSVKYKKNITIIATSINNPRDIISDIVKINPPKSYDL